MGVIFAFRCGSWFIEKQFKSKQIHVMTSKEMLILEANKVSLKNYREGPKVFNSCFMGTKWKKRKR